MEGSVTRRGKHSWRLKFDVGTDPSTGRRLTRYVTVRGTKKAAQSELARLLAAHDAGTLIEPTKVTVSEYLRSWIDTAEALSISPKTAERYRQLIERQMVPFLGSHQLQKLKAAHLVEWHAKLLRVGAPPRRKVREGEPLPSPKPLAPRTIAHAHRVLHKALSDGVKREVLTRNPAALVDPPKVASTEIQTLTADEVAPLLETLQSSGIFPQVAVLLATGMRRGELVGLRWSDIDLDAGKLRIERSVEKTKTHGLRIKAPKTEHGRRRIALPAGAVAVLRQHRKVQLELRLGLGLGRLPDDAFVFGTFEGNVSDPDRISWEWRRLVKAGRLPNITLHALRHSHASALIAAGTDPVTVSRRLGHGSPGFTLKTYAHLFDQTDEAAAAAIDAMMGGGKK